MTIFLKNSRIINQSSEFNSVYPGSIDTNHNHKLDEQKSHTFMFKIADDKNHISFHNSKWAIAIISLGVNMCESRRQFNRITLCQISISSILSLIFQLKYRSHWLSLFSYLQLRNWPTSFYMLLRIHENSTDFHNLKEVTNFSTHYSFEKKFAGKSLNRNWLEIFTEKLECISRSQVISKKYIIVFWKTVVAQGKLAFSCFIQITVPNMI